ncbi:MAG TPA: hypothetical protein VGB26_01170 [Nitrospiria bacterium]
MKKSFYYIFIAAFLILSGCAEDDSKEIYIPAKNYQEALYIWIQDPEGGEIRENKWYQIKAQRHGGPWKKVKFSTLKKGDCWIELPSPEIEENIENNVRWISTPTFGATFDIPELPQTQGRRVRFEKQGIYQLKAESPTRCKGPMTSNVLRVHVKPEKEEKK